jgi:hypothetical protein
MGNLDQTENVVCPLALLLSEIPQVENQKIEGSEGG